jgi:small-conductance mechanosensitive channel
MLMRKKHFSVACMFFIVWFLASGSFSQEAEQKYTSTTISDPQIPVGDLELLLKPLTKSELIVEAEAEKKIQEKVEAIDQTKAEVELQFKIKERFDKEGVSMPYPQHDVHIYQSTKGG